MKEKLIEWLKLPQTKDIDDLDDPATTILHSQIIRNKKFLFRVYREFYRRFERSLTPLSGDETIVELGSGGGFIKEIVPNVITSDILQIPSVDVSFSAQHMPFKGANVDAFLMIDVFHHIKDPSVFLNEMNRCLKPNGKILMIEPANTLWARFIWSNFHHENFDPTSGWRIKGEGPMSDANGALPWIIFNRDKEKFYERFPHLELMPLKAHTPLKYLLSGGLSIKQLLPSFCYPFIQAVEFIVFPLNSLLGMFYYIEIVKKERNVT